MEENEMVFSRMSFWQFKEGKRPEAFNLLDTFLNSLIVKEGGFRGYISILSYTDSNLATIITLWEDEAALVKSGEGTLLQAISSVHEFLTEEPRIEIGHVFSMELYQRESAKNA
jgi:quinol monooxygenase YgiN